MARLTMHSRLPTELASARHVCAFIERERLRWTISALRVKLALVRAQHWWMGKQREET
ncbi:hypothetical protein [Bosea rubneri]|uniref:Transposase n=1 Tax=Bosea rubneri TaxID=3075434 RepID=A0ABU3S467_9HYPH|nr:hypothetical protein [Bosea sp. ZW T0_25]MDU0339563.1 hypothetical protein [Bosea sp. ZW T0_25]